MKGRVLITGASGGIGMEMAREFAQRGHDLILVARSVRPMEELADELRQKHSIQVQVLAKDLSIPGAAQDIYDEVQALGLPVEMLINNAGYGAFGWFETSDLQNDLNMVRLNVETLMHLTKLFLPVMKQRRRGYIMNVASTVAFQPVPTMAVYGATKAFVLSFSEAIANELVGTGIRVMALCPGATESGFAKTANLGKIRTQKQDSPTVARYAVHQLLHTTRVVAMPGFWNRLSAFSLRLMPRGMVAHVARKFAGTPE